MSEYKAGGKGRAPRRSFTPSWVGLEEIERHRGIVVFRTSTGTLHVPEKKVKEWERRMK